ncbi:MULTISPECIES: hypothetical protein [unclassified Streptomyces]|uniref:hypothetical protein n=1 Tax=unclassified Streptomyces TaxID=2593676 RepID=UPI0006AE6FAA|nr:MULTISPECIES: hypothetical protein [unclassified Streptomyces]
MNATVTGLLPVAPPDPARPDAGLVLASLWHTEGPEQQRKVMSGVMDAWEATRLPAAYLARHCLAGSDGRTVLNFAQWTTSEAHRAFAADPGNQQTLGSAVQALYSAGPPGRYAPHRFTARREGVVRCLTATRHDTEDAGAARSLADELTGRDTAALAEYFYVGEDGRQLLVLAGFEDEPGGDETSFRPFRGLVRPVRQGPPQAMATTRAQEGGASGT